MSGRLRNAMILSCATWNQHFAFWNLLV